MELLQLVEMMTVVVTFLMIFSGIPPCINMYKSKETKNIPFVFFLVCFTTCSTGLYYGIQTENSLLKLINTVGTVFWAVYVLLYLHVTNQKGEAIVKVLGMCTVLLSQMVYLMYVVQESHLIIAKLGTLLFMWSTIISGIPLVQIRDVLKKKSADSIQPSMLSGGLLCNFTWLLYGYLIGDFNIYAPNIVALSINVTLAGLFLTFRDNRRQKME